MGIGLEILRESVETPSEVVGVSKEGVDALYFLLTFIGLVVIPDNGDSGDFEGPAEETLEDGCHWWMFNYILIKIYSHTISY